ncbi:MAG TPA: DUF2079 domain-containing protein, partial [Candidatus Eremiobacteraceae bacterium]|nr:DUF2079 domain-containing protein [Candidatus Eremiobacteraceae bacterium]
YRKDSDGRIAHRHWVTGSQHRAPADSAAGDGYRWLLLAVVLYALAAGALVTIHWVRWQTGVDTGINTQVVLGTLHGFHSTFEGGSDLAVHFSPLLAIFYPLLLVTRSGLALEYAQVALIACVPLAMYALVRPHVAEPLAVRAGLISLLYPPLATIGIGEFHILACVPLLVIGLLWAADRGRWGWFSLLAVLALAVREDVLLELAAIGLVCGIVLLRSRHGIGTLLESPQLRRTFGLALLALGGGAIAVALAYFGILQPANSRYGWYPLLYYHIGARPRSGIAALPPVPPPPNPAGTPLMATMQRFTYLCEAFVPLALLPLRTWWWLLALPGLAIVLLATSQSIRTMGAQYSLLWAPWLLIATAIALIAINSAAGSRVATRWADVALGACVFFLIFINPMHLSYYLRAPYHDLAGAKRALACVPPDASLSTHDEWFTHIAGVYPRANGNVIEGVEYLVYADDYPDPTFEREVKPKLQKALASGRLRVVCSAGQVHTYAPIR